MDRIKNGYSACAGVCSEGWYGVTAEVDTGHGPDNEGICHASPYFVWKESK